MPRVITVKSARKVQGNCSKCGAKITKGFGYRWWKFNFGSRHVRCLKPECTPKASDLTRSEFYSRLYEIGDSMSAALDGLRNGADPADAASMLTEAAEQIRELGQDCQDKLANMPEGLQEGDTGQLLQERADECESKADELESAAGELESLDLYDDLDEYLKDNPLEREKDESETDYQTRVQTAMNEHNEQERDTAASNAEVDLSIS